MKPFRVSTESSALADHYPSPETVAAVIPRLSMEELANFASLWLSEGIPKAFLPHPMAYQAMREWLGGRLEVTANDITLIGSARIGYSMAPRPKFGRSFSDNSDLDLAIISERFFTALVADVESWTDDYGRGDIKPNRRQSGLWKENLRLLPGNVDRGFIDPYKVPALSRYPAAAKVQNVQWMLREKLNLTEKAPRVRRVSIRVYRDWPAFARQMAINLRPVRQLESRAPTA